MFAGADKVPASTRIGIVDWPPTTCGQGRRAVTNDVLQKIVPLIQGKSLMLYEKGDLHFIDRHPDFRLVACMNPANDSGKKPLPPNLAEQFTSIVMSEPSASNVLWIQPRRVTEEIKPSG